MTGGVKIWIEHGIQQEDDGSLVLPQQKERCAHGMMIYRRRRDVSMRG